MKTLKTLVLGVFVVLAASGCSNRGVLGYDRDITTTNTPDANASVQYGCTDYAVNQNADGSTTPALDKDGNLIQKCRGRATGSTGASAIGQIGVTESQSDAQILIEERRIAALERISEARDRRRQAALELLGIQGPSPYRNSNEPAKETGQDALDFLKNKDKK